MSIFSCSTEGWSSSPPLDSNQILLSMKHRIEIEEKYKLLNPTLYESSSKNLERFLRKHFYDIEIALARWQGWVEWRREVNSDGISDEEVKFEQEESIFLWKGVNKLGMKCCVITGRMLKPSERQGTFNSFRKYLIKFVEEGLKSADESNQDKICVIYDRRGLEYENIDPNLYQFCRKTIEELKEWYGDRIGAIYILHVNLIFWALYFVVVQPLSIIWSPASNLIVVETPEELLDYFDEDQLQLLRIENT